MTHPRATTATDATAAAAAAAAVADKPMFFPPTNCDADPVSTTADTRCARARERERERSCGGEKIRILLRITLSSETLHARATESGKHTFVFLW